MWVSKLFEKKSTSTGNKTLAHCNYYYIQEKKNVSDEDKIKEVMKFPRREREMRGWEAARTPTRLVWHLAATSFRSAWVIHCDASSNGKIYMHAFSANLSKLPCRSYVTDPGIIPRSVPLILREITGSSSSKRCDHLDGWLQIWKSHEVVVTLAAPLRVNVFAFHD